MKRDILFAVFFTLNPPLNLFLQVIWGLSHLQSFSIVYTDLKPSSSPLLLLLRGLAGSTGTIYQLLRPLCTSWTWRSCEKVNRRAMADSIMHSCFLGGSEECVRLLAATTSRRGTIYTRV
jgi:hypothetical protein